MISLRLPLLSPYKTAFTTVLLFSVFALASAAASSLCPFLSLDETTPVSFELEKNALLPPLEFKGLVPTVTRKTLPFGSTPKVTVTRYSSSSPPVIAYDDEQGHLVISASQCSSNGDSSQGTSAAAATVTTSRWMQTAAAVAIAGLTQSPILTAVAFLHGITAQDNDECSASVHVVVEAPSSYEGAVETCWREVNDTAICPDPFPTYPTCDDPNPICPVAIVGAGTGGLYTAMRLLDEGAIEGSDICVFEMTERVGGRLFSLRGLGPDGDLTVDAGGYRTWPEFTPTVHALITEYLNITMDCYDDTDPCEVYNIVDDKGKKAGFATFVELMMQKLVDAGACFYPYHELKSISKTEKTAETRIDASKLLMPSEDSVVTELVFTNGVVARATATTILNMPQRPLLTVLRNSNLDEEGIINMDILDALHSVQTVVATKFYLYYPRGHVWWKQLNIGSGDFESSGDARSMLLAGRYHDGQVECDDDNDPDTCHGFLLATYANDLSGNKAQFFRRFQRVRPEPVTFIDNSDMEGRYLLQHAHQRLRNFHLYENTAANTSYTGFEANRVFQNIDPPTFGILSTWNGAIPWAGGAWHSWTDTTNIDLAKQPLVNDNIFVVNEAYSLLQGWAEGTIKLADEVLQDHFGIERPWDFEVLDINQLVRQTNSEECVEGAVESGGGGAAANADTGGGVDATAAVLCFSGDALVTMADGSYKEIRDVKVGDIVQTGTGVGAGVVTEALAHPVQGVVPVAILDTEVGDLVGTVDHPVLHMGEWIEFQNLPVSRQSNSGMDSDGSYVTLSEQYIDTFYNLEIDADDVEGSSHSYVVNGVVASGLGDNHLLNTRFARQ